MTAIESDIYLSRQPVVDGAHELLGFYLHFSDARLDGAATAAAVTDAFAALGLDRALGALRAYIDVDGELLANPAIEQWPAARIVLVVPPGLAATPAVVERCTALRALGFGLALAAAEVGDAARTPLYPLATLFTADLGGPDAPLLQARLAGLKRWPAHRLATGVVDPARFAAARGLGFDQFAGYHFARPAAGDRRPPDASKLALLKLLTQIDEDAETPVLEASFKQAPGLSVNLLRLVNSAASGRHVRIASLRHAITVLGRRPLARWLQLLLFADPTTPARLTNPLLQLAATRGRLMERLGHHVAAGDAGFADQAFVCGVMSLTPALLGLPIAQILTQISLAGPISEALASGRGRLGQLLAVVEAMEADALPPLRQALLTLPMLHAGQLGAALAEALNWADHIGEEAPD